MTLVTASGIVADDYVAISDEAPLAVGGRILLSWARWSQEPVESRPNAELTGLVLPNTLDVAAMWESLRQHPLIVLEFPSFADGRAYSQARLLSDRFGYAGELRAAGKAVVLDQLPSLLRCGFSSFQLRDDQNVQSCIAALNSHSRAYQPAADGSPAILCLRRA